MRAPTTRRLPRVWLPFVISALVAGVATAQTVPPRAEPRLPARNRDAVPWTPGQIRAFVVAAYPSLLEGDTAIGHVNILLDANDALVRTTTGASDSVKVWLAGDKPGTGRTEGYRIGRAPNGQGYIEPTSTPPSHTSYGLDGIDPATLDGAHLYGFAAGEIGPRKLSVAVLVQKRAKL